MRARLLFVSLLLLFDRSRALNPKLSRGRSKVAADFALSIAGMTTPHCASRVREALNAVPGVTIAEVMLPGSALVVCRTCSSESLIKAVASAGGFAASVEAEKNEADGSPPGPPMSDDAQRVSEAFATEAGRASLIMDTSFAGSAVVELSDRSFRNTVGFGEDLWLVFFYFRDRCPLCYLRGEEMKKAAKLLEGTGVRIGAVDVDQRGDAAGISKRMRVTGTNLKNLGAKEHTDPSLPRPGPAPLVKVFDTAQKITARRGILEAPDLTSDVPIKAEVIAEWATMTLLARRTAEQLAEELSGGQPLLATWNWESTMDVLQQIELSTALTRLREIFQSQIDEGKPTPLLIATACLATYLLLSCGLQFSLSRQRAAKKKLSEQQKAEREAFERKEREAMAAARAKQAQQRAEAQTRKEQAAADARAQKTAEAARKKVALSEGRQSAVANMQSAADRRAAMQEKIRKMSKADPSGAVDDR